MRKFCPYCKRALKKRYTWREILASIFCFPCLFFCYKRRTQMFKCKYCDVEIVISDGTFPGVVRTYKTYNDFSWQFPRIASSRSVRIKSEPKKTNSKKHGKVDMPKSFSSSTQCTQASFATAKENFDATESSESYSTPMTTTTNLTKLDGTPDATKKTSSNNNDGSTNSSTTTASTKVSKKEKKSEVKFEIEDLV